MNLQQQIQELSAMRNDLYAKAGQVSLSNPEQAKSIWTAADKIVEALNALELAESLEPKEPVFSGDPWVLLA